MNRLMYKDIAIGVVLFLLEGCAAPKESASLKDSPSSSTSKTAGSTSAGGSGSGFSFDAGGVDLPTDSASNTAARKTCIGTKNFFDRRQDTAAKVQGVGTCTTEKLADVACKTPAIETFMTADQQTQFHTVLSQSLQAFKLDQCLDCSSPTSALCKGPNATTTLEPGMRLFFINPTDGKILSVYIQKIK